MNLKFKLFLTPAIFVLFFLRASPSNAQSKYKVWPAEKAMSWYSANPWLVGSNYITSSAVNQLEMWQATTFDAARIDTELGWAEKLGMNTMRVFLHDLLWQDGSHKEFKKRLDRFLTIAAKHHIKPLLVLFDSCWNPNPHLGTQPAPIQGVHNSGWVQSPGKSTLENEAEYPKLKAYVTGVVGAFAHDDRILGWDVWNEPDNLNDMSYVDSKTKIKFIEKLLPQVFDWVRSKHPDQPVTSAVWKGDWSGKKPLTVLEQIQIDDSDIITFHNYGHEDDFERRVEILERYHRPVLCTEYMARPIGSTFEKIMPVAKRHHVAIFNWGFVAGKSQTYIPWDSWQKPSPEMPKVWFHDIFYADGKVYKPEEVEFIHKTIVEK